jgi:ketosteroid isomerase-like protein
MSAMNPAEANAENKLLVQRFIAAFAEARHEDMAELITDDFVWHIAVTPPGEATAPAWQSRLLARTGFQWVPIRDRAAFLRHLARRPAQLTVRIHVFNLIAEGDQVAAEAVAEGTGWANGRQLRNCLSLHFTVAGGKIRLFREYMDTLHRFDVQDAE